MKSKSESGMEVFKQLDFSYGKKIEISIIAIPAENDPSISKYFYTRIEKSHSGGTLRSRSLTVEGISGIVAPQELYALFLTNDIVVRERLASL